MKKGWTIMQYLEHWYILINNGNMLERISVKYNNGEIEFTYKPKKYTHIKSYQIATKTMLSKAIKTDIELFAGMVFNGKTTDKIFIERVEVKEWSR